MGMKYIVVGLITLLSIDLICPINWINQPFGQQTIQTVKRSFALLAISISEFNALFDSLRKYVVYYPYSTFIYTDSACL